MERAKYQTKSIYISPPWLILTLPLIVGWIGVYILYTSLANNNRQTSIILFEIYFAIISFFSVAFIFLILRKRKPFFIEVNKRGLRTSGIRDLSDIDFEQVIPFSQIEKICIGLPISRCLEILHKDKTLERGKDLKTMASAFSGKYIHVVCKDRSIISVPINHVDICDLKRKLRSQIRIEKCI